MAPKTVALKSWEVQLEGAMQAQAQTIVNKATKIAGSDIRQVRVAYSPNAPIPVYEMMSDGKFALVLDAKTLALKEEASKLLVALHELMHEQDIQKFGLEAMRKLAGNPQYEIDVEKRALQLLQEYYKKPLPQETMKLHSDLMKLLSK